MPSTLTNEPLPATVAPLKSESKPAAGDSPNADAREKSGPALPATSAGKSADTKNAHSDNSGDHTDRETYVPPLPPAMDDAELEYGSDR
jgi:hypothetical protein